MNNETSGVCPSQQTSGTNFIVKYNVYNFRIVYLKRITADITFVYS